MQNTPNQGLSGKARRQRFLSRSSRLHHQQLIENYLEQRSKSAEGGESRTAHTEGRDRPIPIGHRREFIPTADPSPDDSAAGQLELSLSPVDDDDVVFVAVPKAKEPRLDISSLHAARRVSRVAPAQQTAANTRRTPSKTPPPVRAIGGVSPERPQSVDKERFRLPGFLFGCAIGTAAATVVLVCIRLALS